MNWITRSLQSGVALLFLVGTLAACGGAEEVAATAAPTVAPAAPTVAATVAPTLAPAAKALVVVGDTVRGTSGLTDAEKEYLGCVQANRFPRGAQIVWRMRAIDPVTAKEMSDKQIQSFTVTLPDGNALKMKYGEHPKQSNIWFWTTSFIVPKDYPTGALDYKLVATDLEGRTGQFNQFAVPSAQLQIIAGTR